MKESVPGFPSVHSSSMRKIPKANMIQRRPRIQEYERVGPWIFLYISFLKRKNFKKPT
jgi:hypothetical protein